MGRKNKRIRNERMPVLFGRKRFQNDRLLRMPQFLLKHFALNFSDCLFSLVPDQMRQQNPLKPSSSSSGIGLVCEKCEATRKKMKSFKAEFTASRESRIEVFDF